MKGITNKIKFTIFLVVIFLTNTTSFVHHTHAIGIQFGGMQMMWWPEAVCNNSSSNVHFIYDNVTSSLLSLADMHSATMYGGMNVNLGLYQMGTYVPSPMPCIANIAGAPVTLWTATGIYSMVATSQAPSTNKTLFAETISPFFKGISPQS